MIKSSFLKVGPTELGYMGQTYKGYQYCSPWVKPIKIMGGFNLSISHVCYPRSSTGPDKNIL